MESGDDSRRERLTGSARRSDHMGAMRYSSVVRKMKIAAPLSAILIILVTILWSGYNQPTIVKQRTPDPSQAAVKNELVKPRFENKDAQGQPYVLSADRALQDMHDEKRITLVKPAGELQLKQGHVVTIRSDAGDLHQDEEKLFLKGHVRLTHDSGYDMTMDELHVNMRDGTALSQTPISGAGPKGTLEATGLEADQKQGALTFFGPAKLVLKSKSQSQ